MSPTVMVREVSSHRLSRGNRHYQLFSLEQFGSNVNCCGCDVITAGLHALSLAALTAAVIYADNTT